MALFGNRKYVEESEIARDHPMRYLFGKGEITEVSLIHVSIQPFGGSCFSIVLEEQQNSVSHLKRAIQQQQGTPMCSLSSCFCWARAPMVREEDPLERGRMLHAAR